jgi:hypothetical protein
MNIIVKDGFDRDPFAQSDRKNPIGGGKGDATRVGDTKKYKSNFDRIFGRRKWHAGKVK